MMVAMEPSFGNRSATSLATGPFDLCSPRLIFLVNHYDGIVIKRDTKTARPSYLLSLPDDHGTHKFPSHVGGALS